MTISNLKRQCSERNSCNFGILIRSLASSLKTGKVTLTNVARCMCCQAERRMRCPTPVGELRVLEGHEVAVVLFMNLPSHPPCVGRPLCNGREKTYCVFFTLLPSGAEKLGAHQ